jgi:O-antigen/teichoic acid export membrane protein
MAGTVRNRLIRGFGATALGPVITAFVQIVSVPIFLHFWGAKMYGEWLILSAIPSYLVLSDLGFGNVAANDMTMRVAAGDRDGALETFQSTWALILIISVVVGLAVLGVIWFLPVAQWLNISSLSAIEVRSIFTLFLVEMLFVVQSSLINAGFRCDGNYAYGMFFTNMVRIAEFGVTVSAVALGARPLKVVGILVVTRACGTLVMGWRMVRKSPWLRFGIANAQFISIRRLASPAFAFMAFPAGNALSVQGMVVMIGVVLGPLAVTAFSTMRTLTRFSFQIVTVIAATIWPELSAAYGAHQWSVARKLHRFACQASLGFSVLSVIGLLFFGQSIIHIWTHGRVAFDSTTFELLLLVIVANAFWYTSSVVPLAANRHEKLALFYLFGSAGSLGLAYLFESHFGLPGAALALLFFESVTGVYTLRRSLEILSDSLGEFTRALCSRPLLSTNHFRLAFRPDSDKDGDDSIPVAEPLT